MYNMTLRNLELVSDCFKTREMCNKAVDMEPVSLVYVADHFKTEEMCKRAVSNKVYTLRYISDHHKAQGTHTRWSMCPIT